LPNIGVTHENAFGCHDLRKAQYSRSQNRMLSQKCELLARLADEGLRGRTAEAVMRTVDSKVLVKIEGGELSLDDVVLRVEGGKVTGVDVAETCR
jgi:plasmid replication initiation protein